MKKLIEFEEYNFYMRGSVFKKNNIINWKI